jgi:hypothetical protein
VSGLALRAMAAVIAPLTDLTAWLSGRRVTGLAGFGRMTRRRRGTARA